MAEVIYSITDILLKLCWLASATLPILAALGLAAGRKSNAQLCLFGSRVLMQLCFTLALAGIIYFPFDYWRELAGYNTSASSLWRPFFMAAGLPWSISMLIQIAGAGLVKMAELALPINSNQNHYPFAFVKCTVILLLCAAFCFLATLFFISWPFAGLPPELTLERVISAVLRNAVRHYFMALTPAGAIALLYFYKTPLADKFGGSAGGLACRWLAFWACIGLIPQVAQDWAILMGLGLRGNVQSYFPGGLPWYLAGLILLTFAMFFWFAQALIKRAMPGFAIGGFVFYICQAILPALRQTQAILEKTILPVFT